MPMLRATLSPWMTPIARTRFAWFAAPIGSPQKPQ
jgi:hypothetical protein